MDGQAVSGWLRAVAWAGIVVVCVVAQPPLAYSQVPTTTVPTTTSTTVGTTTTTALLPTTTTSTVAPTTTSTTENPLVAPVGEIRDEVSFGLSLVVFVAFAWVGARLGKGG